MNTNINKKMWKFLLGKVAFLAALPLFFVLTAFPVFGQAQADVKFAGVFYTKTDENAPIEQVYCNWGNTFKRESTDNRSFVSTNIANGNNGTDSDYADPWENSALIEYDQPYPSPTAGNNYPNHCLGLCMEVYCSNKPMAMSTYSISFPLQTIKFDIIKYENGKNISSENDTPPLRTITMYPGAGSESTGAIQDYTCGSYHCYDAQSGTTCPSAIYYCNGERSSSWCVGDGATVSPTQCASLTEDKATAAGCFKFNTCGEDDSTYNKCCSTTYGGTKGSTNCVIFDNNGAEYGEAMQFCAGWDGSYEIAGEFGKMNGQYGFRATVQSEVPGDNITVDKITINSSVPYPGENQIPIQIDVTNVHTVRSTPTVVGDITSVSAQPYTLAYRLSKDSNVRIAIYDVSNPSDLVYNSTEEGQDPSKVNFKETALRRLLVDWQPRLGEGMKGQSSDKQLVEFDSWDGRDDSGRLLPAGNYLVSIQAKSQDEWPGVDFSRAVTRQLSLDPLKLTDVVVSGLNKQSTAYATIKYVPTEASKVYFQVYSPGTQFDSTFTPTTGTAQGPAIATTGSGESAVPTGYLLYSSVEERGSRATYTTKWNGTCTNTEVCPVSGNPTPIPSLDNKQFFNGAPLPDGNYVYVLWAEIPYQESYENAAGVTYDAVKTTNYLVGTMPIERGLVDITIQPVSYSTVGSSPTAYGLDPFIFKYILSRDAVAVASVQNSAGVTVKMLTPEEGTSGVAQQINTLSWDGRDDDGRMVGPGTYVFAVTSKDAMFPEMQTTATAVFPVDLYHVVDVGTTDVYGDSEAKATISYYLSKAMNVQVNIYNKDVVIPVFNYSGTSSTISDPEKSYTPSLPTGVKVGDVTQSSSTMDNNNVVKVTITQKEYLTTSATDLATLCAGTTDTDLESCKTENAYTVITTTITNIRDLAVWPPRVCNKQDTDIMTNGYVDPAKVASTGKKCIYVNDTSFTNYPANANYTELDVRLQPIKTFDASSTRPGEGARIVEEWDALYFYNPSSQQCQGATDIKACAYEMVPDGQYPFYISARSNEPVSLYYADRAYTKGADNTDYDYAVSEPFKTKADVQQADYIYATEKPNSRINVTRGPVFFLEGSTAVYPNQPQLFNTSSGTVFVPPYEVNFAVSRAATVDVEIIALKPNVCTTSATDGSTKNNAVGDVCKHLSSTTILDTGNFNANAIHKVYWDGTDDNGYYVKSAVYEVRLIAKNYPDANLYQETVKSLTLNADLLQVFDLAEVDGYAQSTRGQVIPISYQLSVPMKVAIQIFKPGTTIYDYEKGTLRNPATGKEVQDINEVLVRTIVGIRPSTTLITEEWDGRDYAQQEVPDGTYPFRFVTATNSADIDTITGEILPGDDSSTDSTDWKVNYVADTYQYQTLHKATVAVGDGRFVCEDWEKTVFFYPNPLRQSYGTLEVTKMPVPGTMSIKLFTLSGTLIRDSGYTCVDANNYTVTMGSSLEFSPDNNISGTVADDSFANVRNAALRCRWDKTNQHGKKVARGVYFGLVDFKAQNGREHCQKVVKILVP